MQCHKALSFITEGSENYVKNRAWTLVSYIRNIDYLTTRAELYHHRVQRIEGLNKYLNDSIGIDLCFSGRE